MIPLFLIFYTIMFGVYGYAEGVLISSLIILAFFYIVGIILFVFFRQCKNIYYDKDNLYINSVFKNKLIHKISLNHIETVKNYILFIKIAYNEEGKKNSVYTVQNRKAISEAYGMHELSGFELLWGKPNFRVEQLKRIIIDKKSSHANT